MTWLQLPGRVKGRFKNLFEADAYIDAKWISSDSELEPITTETSKSVDMEPIESDKENEPGELKVLKHLFCSYTSFTIYFATQHDFGPFETSA